MSERIVIESTCIASVAFSRDDGVLRLEFRNGLSYEYLGVPASLFAALLSAPSKGSFVSRFIRGQFEFRRL